MEITDVYHELARLVSADEAACILAALRQDGFMWERLQQPACLAAMTRSAGGLPARWNAGVMALLALGIEPDTSPWRSAPLGVLPSPWSERAMQVYQSAHAAPGAGPATFEEAALLALALREKRRKSGDWASVVAIIHQRAGMTGDTPPGWRSAVACLYALVPDPENMLRALLPRQAGRQSFEWAAHARLCCPAADSDHVEVFTALLKNQPLDIQAGFLRSLNLHGRTPVAAAVAEKLASDHPAFASLRLQTGLIRQDVGAVVARAFMLHQLGALYQVAGNRSQALSFLHSAESTLKQWLAGLYVQEMNVTGGDGPDPSLADDARLGAILASARRIPEELGVVLGGYAGAEEAIEKLAEGGDPIVQIFRAAQLCQQGDAAVARDLASQGVRRLVEKINQSGLPFWGDFVYQWQPGAILQALREMDMENEALTLARAFLSARPTDTALLQQASRLCEKTGDLNGAIENALVSATLEPCDPAWRRRLGQLWMKTQEWQRAFDALERVMTLADPPSLADRLMYARAALLSGALQTAVETCERILEIAPENGEATALEGQALAELGETERAVAFLTKANQISPENPVPWLVLASIQQEKGEQQQSLNTLRSASQAISVLIPGAADVFLALGEACLDSNLESEALGALEKACALSPTAIKPAYLYGKALRSQGRSSEARSVLEATRPAWEDQPEMAYEYARAAQESRDFGGMVSALDAALHPAHPHTKDLADRAPLDWLLLYARLMLGELPGSAAVVADLMAPEARYARAERAIKEILERDPEHYDARFFLGLIHLNRDNAAEALSIFKELEELPAVQNSELYWRVQWGVGRSAMRLDQYDLALASLREACQKRPDRLELQRDLAEVSAGANLRQEALAAAKNALQLAPDRADNLVWYAQFAEPLGERKAALDALECAVQIEPGNPALRVRLAEMLWSAHESGAAHASLDLLLSLPHSSSIDLQRAAELYLKMEDQPAALQCLQRALDSDPAPSLDLLYHVASLQDRLGEPEAALASAQRALNDPVRAQSFEHLSLYLLQAALLEKLDRGQAALASLEKALSIVEERQSSLEGAHDMHLGGLLADIHARFCALLSQMDHLPEAFYHAEKALDLRPDDLTSRARAASLALAMLQTERAVSIANAAESSDALPERMTADSLEFLLLKVEIAFQSQADETVLPEKADQLVEAGLYQTSNYPAPLVARLLAAKARCLARQGDLSAAAESYQAALDAWKTSGSQNKPGPWMAEAALEAQRWVDALRLGEAYVRLHPSEARGQYVWMKAIVSCAEREWLCEAVDCQAHAPGREVLSEAARQSFEQASQAAGALANNQASSLSEVRRWQLRGQAVFSPSIQTARDLSAIASAPQALPSDVAALVNNLRLLRRMPSALAAAEACLDDPRVAFQAALCSLGDPSAKKEEIAIGLDLARRLAQDYPQNPLHHALLAKLAQQAGEPSEALPAYEHALRWWPSEPAWHDAAGDLAFRLDDDLQGMLHREQALALGPANVDYALKLGEASLMQENVSRAVEVLEMASRIREEDLKVWQALSIAYRQAGRLPDALEAALRAAQLAPDSGKSYLLAGETALAMDQREPAIEYGRKALLREPDDADAILFLSRVLAEADRPGEALEVLENASASIRNVFPIAFERARMIHRYHGAQAALEPLEKLAADYQEEPALLAFLARAHAECGNLSSAEKHGFKSLHLNANQPDLSYLLGCWQHKAGQLDHAVHLLSESTRLDPLRLDAYLELGAVYLERREPHLALQTYRQAIDVAPGDHRAYFQSGLILRDAKDYAAAETMLRRSADLAPKDAAVRRQLVAVIALNLVHNKQEVNTLP